MSSATETALLALAAMLTTLAAAGTPAIPTPLRNEDLAARLTDIGSADVQAYLNQWDGEQVEREEYLGAYNGSNGYEITHQAKLELAVTGGTTAAAREAAFDAAMVAIFGALAADRTLGGTVDDADFGDLQFQGSGLVTDGVPHAKGVVIPVVLTFRSSRPF